MQLYNFIILNPNPSSCRLLTVTIRLIKVYLIVTQSGCVDDAVEPLLNPFACSYVNFGNYRQCKTWCFYGNPTLFGINNNL